MLSGFFDFKYPVFIGLQYPLFTSHSHIRRPGGALFEEKFYKLKHKMAPLSG